MAAFDLEAHAQDGFEDADLILRVDGEDGSATGDGTTWDAEDAYLYLQDALDDALLYLSFPEHQDHFVDIWVRGAEMDSPTGPIVYYPDEGANQSNNSRSSTFRLWGHVQLLAGFAGTESVREDRSPLVNITILSGDLAKDDNPANPFDSAATDDNAYSVVTTENFESFAVIDGFEIRAGNSTDVSGTGAGLFIDDQSIPIVLRCTMRHNQALIGAGAAVERDSIADFFNCVFKENIASIGAGLAQDVSTSTLVNCLFHDNTASGDFGFGGAIYNFEYDLYLINCTIADNAADEEAGGVYNTGSARITVTNSILWGNTAGSGTTSAQQLTNCGSATVSYSDLQGGWSGTGSNNIGGGLGDDPDFDNPAAGDYELQSSSPCIDEANSAAIENYPDDFDIDRDADITEATPELDLDCRVVTVVDMGAHEFQVDPRPPCPADIFPLGSGNCLDDGDASVSAGDLGELLANWGSNPSNDCADIYPVGSPDGTVGAGDLGELLANWGQCPRTSCTESFAGFGDGGNDGTSDVGFTGDEDWPEVEMTDELYDWIMTSPLYEIWEWLWSLLEP